MSNIRVTITGQITHGRNTLTCPNCQANRGWLITGARGSAATVRCPNRHSFWPSAPFDPQTMLAALAMPGARSSYPSLELG